MGAGTVTSPKGFQAGGVYAGIKEKGKDIALLVSESPAQVAGVFTTNRVPAHCVVYNKERVAQGTARALVVNSGNANCCTGEQGRLDTLEMARYTATSLGIPQEQVLVLSTGVIGERLPMDKIRSGIDQAANALSPEGGRDAAEAILTTDTVAKYGSIPFDIHGKECCIGVMAKGSGMIHPNLATMFCIFTTDVAIDSSLLKEAFFEVMDDSFNVLTVDGEMSTNDTALILANGAAGNRSIAEKNNAYTNFVTALRELAIEATKAIARDGEGATKLVTVEVSGAATTDDAIRAGKSIANSMLVKTALFGNDPNWGRIVQAAGASGADINPDRFAVHCAGIRVAENGGQRMFDEIEMRRRLKQPEVTIGIDLGVGDKSAVVYTCDLSYDYVRINAEYHT